MPLEREIKLRFDSADEARERILALGATPLLGRGSRKIACSTPKTSGCACSDRRCACASEGGKSLLTFKGPVIPAAIKIREEHETVVADGAALHTILEELGLHVWFRYEKYREEFQADDVVIAVDETPVGVFVEIEGGEDAIHADGARARTHRRRTTSPTRTASCSSSIATQTASTDTTWCSPAATDADAGRPRRRMIDLVSVAGAGADRRPRHAPSAALDRPRQGRAAGRRHAAGRAHPALAARRRRPPRRPQPASPRRNHHAHRRRRLLGLEVRYSWETDILGSAGGPARALPLLDVRSLPDRQRRHAGRRRLGALAAQHVDDQRARDDGGRRRAAAIQRRHRRAERHRARLRARDRGAFHFIGVQAVERGGVRRRRSGRPIRDRPRHLPGADRQPARRGPHFPHARAEFFDIGIAARLPRHRHHDRARASSAAARSRQRIAWSRRMRRSSDTILWDRVRVGAGAALTDCIVADDVTVPPGARYSRCSLVMRDNDLLAQRVRRLSTSMSRTVEHLD